MIPRVQKRGSRTVGLIFYLYEPGRCEEHTDPHLVAAWDAFAPDPGRHPDATYDDLAQLLDQPVDALSPSRRPDQHVWHLSVRAAPEDPLLTDEQWADIARRMAAATGIAPTGDDTACRWAAVRHADDHIHIVATLVREDGRRPRLNNDAARAQAEARLLEAEYGLRQLNPGDGTAAKRPTSAERHKAKRENRPQTPREELRETVRHAAAGTMSETEFFDRLAAAGLLVHQRVAPSGDLLGYKVALPDDRNHDGEPVFYAGSTLAPDLSLPRIRKRWTTSQPEPEHGASAGPQWPGPAGAKRRASTTMWQALLVIDHGTDEQIAAHITGAGEVLDALATTSADLTRNELRQAAFLFERATRSHTQAERGHDRALRQAARDLVRSGPALGHGEDGATTAMVIDMAFFLITAAAQWHAKRNHAQQAAAARQTAQHLRTAYRAAARHPMAVLHRQGQHLTQPRLQQQPHTYAERSQSWPNRSSPNPAGTPSPPPSPTPKPPDTNQPHCSPEPPDAASWTPPTPSATYWSGGCAASPNCPPTRSDSPSGGSSRIREQCWTVESLAVQIYRANGDDPRVRADNCVGTVAVVL